LHVTGSMLLLKIQWELFGLKAPAFSWLVSLFLILYSIYVYWGHRRASRNRQRVLAIAEKRLGSIRSMAPAHPGEGMARSIYDSLSSAFEDLPLLQAAWQAIASSIVVTRREEEERFWIGDDIGQILSGAGMIDNQSYRTAPTVISGIGLLATFLAILVALLDVRLVQNRVQGLDLLVQGLSGKFLSSVVAVACATILIHAEKGLSRPVRAAVASLASALRTLLPRLAPAQILSDLHREIAAQSKMFGIFRSELGQEIREGVAEGVRPALSDLKASLDRTSSGLDETFVGTREHLSRASGSLVETAALLKKMNEHMVGKQGLFNDKVERALETIAREAAGREARMEQLTHAVNGLAAKLQVPLNSESTLHLSELLERHGAEITRVEDLKGLLDDTIRGFIASIEKYGLVTEGLQQVFSQVNKGIDSLGQTAKSITQSQEEASRVWHSLAEEIKSIRDFSQSQRAVWAGIQSAMVEYEKVFSTVEGHAAEMLAHISHHLQSYSEATERHFANLALAADNLVSQATGRLSGSIDELSEQLDDLQSMLGGTAHASQGMR